MFCTKCGANLPQNANVCPKCGVRLNNTQNNSSDFFKNLNGADTTREYDPMDIANNKGLSILSYLGILFLIPLLTAKHSKFAQFHAKQGFTLFLADLVLGMLGGFVSMVFNGLSYISYLSFFFIMPTVVLGAFGVLSLVLKILGIVYSAQGQAKELPVIGKIKILK